MNITDFLQALALYRQSGLKLDQEETFVTALTLWRESRGEPRMGKAGVMAVIQNRANDQNRRWPRTLERVCLQPKQFSCYNVGEPNATAWPDPAKSADWQAWLECLELVQHPLPDPTGGANHYHDDSMLNNLPVRAWLGEGKTVADLQAKQTAKIGRFTFYRL